MKRLIYSYKDCKDGSRAITVKNYSTNLLIGLQKLRDNKSLCDVILKVEGHEVYAHRAVLVVCSEYFRGMFADGFNEMQARGITLPAESGVDRWSAEALVQFMYTGTLTVTSQTAQGLIMAADLWQMTEVKEKCEDFMERQIDTENCLGVLNFAEVYRCGKLRLKATQIIKQRFPVVVQSVEFLHLSRQLFTEILLFPDLNLGLEGEDVVLKAVMRWFATNPRQRIADLPALLSHVRLGQTSRECRLQLLDSNASVQKNCDVLLVIDSQLQEVGVARTPQISLFVIGGFLQSRTGPMCPRLNSVEKFDPKTNAWSECGSLPMKAAGSFSFAVYGHLFCAAFQPIDVGHRIAANLALETDIYEYSFVRDEWVSSRENFSPEALESIDTCLQAEGALTVCAKTSTIYAVSNREMAALPITIVNGTVSCRTVHLLPRPRAASGLAIGERHRLLASCVLDGRLYVLGGDAHDGGSDAVPTAQVLIFDPENHQWQERAPMRETRAALAVAALDGFIYACGGFNVRRLETLERYDPENDSWTSLQSMGKYRSHHQLLALYGRLWAVGGKSYAVANGGARKVLNLCEVYDPHTDRWTDGVPMKYARCGFSAVAV